MECLARTDSRPDSRRLLLAAVMVTVLLVPTALVSRADVDEDSGLPDIDSLWDYAQPDKSEARFRAYIDQAREEGGPDYHAQLLTQIARAQGLQRQFDEAHATLDQVQRMTAARELPVAHIRYLLERGRVYNSSGEPAKAMPLFKQALAAAKPEGQDFYAVDAAHMIAIISPPAEALQWNQRAIALAENAREERAKNWLGSLYNNTGWALHDMGRYEEALATFEKALAWRQEQGQEKEARIAQWCVARTLRSLGRIDEALAMQTALATDLDTLGESDGYVEEEIAECLLALGREEEARPHFARAFEQLANDPWLVAQEPQRLARLQKLGGLDGASEPADDEK
jgi:tetratricopeptide (TPR) repeat protein